MRFTRLQSLIALTRKELKSMSARQYLSYTYLIGWSKQDLWYYGVRWTQKRKTEFDIGIHYFTSSKYVKQARNLYGEPNVIHIDKTFVCKDEAIEYETKVLREHDCKNLNHWLNRSDGKLYSNLNGKILTKKHKNKISKSLIGHKQTKKTKEKIRIKNSGTTHPNYGGKNETCETRKRKSKSKIGKNNPMYGKPAANRKKVIIYGITYNSIKEASEKLEKNRDTIRIWTKTGKAKLI